MVDTQIKYQEQENPPRVGGRWGGGWGKQTWTSNQDTNVHETKSHRSYQTLWTQCKYIVT